MARVGRWLATGLASMVILLALLVGLFRIAVRELPNYQPEIEKFASKTIGHPLHFGHIDARLGLRGPALLLSNVQVLAGDSAEPLAEADSVAVVFSLWELIARQRVVVSGLEVTGVGVAVLRDEEGRFSVLGQGASGDEGLEPTLPLAALPDGRIRIRDAYIDLIDQASRLGDLRFRDVSLDVEKRGTSLSVFLRGDLPSYLGRQARVRLEQKVLQDGVLETQGLLELSGAQFFGFSAFLPDESSVPRAGRGDITVFATYAGAGWTSATVNLSIVGMAAPTRKGEEPGTVFDRIGGQIEWFAKEGGWEFRGSELEFQRAGFTWPRSNFKLEHSRKQDRGSSVYYFEADYLRLQDLLPFSPWIPESAGGAMLESLQPLGEIRGINLQFVPGDEPRYTLQAHLDGMAVGATDAWPGIGGFSGTLSAGDGGGRFLLQSLTSVEMPGVFREPILLDMGQGNIVWRIATNALEFSADDLLLGNADIEASTQFTLEIPGEGGSRLDLETTVHRLVAASKSKYLPAGKLKPNLLAWLDKAIVGGDVPGGKVLFKGQLDKFPFRDGSGLFRASFSLRDGELDYTNGWPPLESFDADVVFENAGMTATVHKGTISGNTVNSGKVSIPSFRDAIVEVDAIASGETGQLLAYAVDSPLAERFPFLRDIQTTGLGKARVDLALPLRRLDESGILVEIDIEDGSVATIGFEDGFQHINGRLTVDDGGVRAADVQAEFLGKPASIDIGPEPGAAPPAATLLLTRSWIDAETLVQRVPILEGHLKGATDWYAVARFPPVAGDELFTVTLRSVLGGLGIDLPAPFYKAGTEVEDFQLVVTMTDEQRRDVRVSAGTQLRGHLVFDSREQWSFRQGTLAFGGQAPSLGEESGLLLTGRLESLRLDDWLALAGSSESNLSLDQVLRAADIEVESFSAFGLILGATRANLRQEQRRWLAEVHSEPVAGSISIPFDLLGDEPLGLDMQRLQLVNWEQSEDERRTDPRSLPALRVAAADFRLTDMRFGSLEAEITRIPEGLGIQRLETRADSFDSRATGSWTVGAGGMTTALTGSIESSNLETTLHALGFGGYIEGGTGKADFDVYWQGPPDRHFLETIGGGIGMELKDGDLVDVDPGAGRALGLLSITALPRRLSLDFSDVFGKGLGFDAIKGDFRLVDGNAYTSNLIMKGPAAGVAISGRTGLAAQDYDQTALVHANIGSTLPVAGAIVGGPVLGIGMWVFSEVFKEPLQGIARARYSITGSWDEPVIEREAYSPAAEVPQPASTDPADSAPEPQEP